MPNKYDVISKLSEETAARVTKDRHEWTDYLTTAQRLYKYPFKDQLLIHAQRPDATACATIDIWNRRMHCWVNKGSKGIALLDDDRQGKHLRYVFDVSDVHAARRIGRYPKPWVLREEHKGAVMARLDETYGVTDGRKPFEERLIETADRIAGDYYNDLMPDLAYSIEGTYLEGLDEQNMGIRLRETLSASISYMLLAACGADMGEYGEELNFDYIHEFNSAKSLLVLGEATSNLAKPVLMEIGRTVRAYDRSHENTKENEKVLANGPEMHYNALKRESVNNTDDERGTENGDKIREERGLPDTGTGGGQPAGGAADEIRDAEGDVPEGETQGGIHRVPAMRGAERAPSDGTAPGGGEDGIPDIPDGKSGGSDGTAKGP